MSVDAIAIGLVHEKRVRTRERGRLIKVRLIKVESAGRYGPYRSRHGFDPDRPAAFTCGVSVAVCRPVGHFIRQSVGEVIGQNMSVFFALGIRRGPALPSMQRLFNVQKTLTLCHGPASDTEIEQSL